MPHPALLDLSAAARRLQALAYEWKAERFRFLFAALALLAAPSIASAQAPGESTPVWRAATEQPAEFEISRDTTSSHGGRASLRIHADEQPSGIGNVLAVLPAASYLGHRIQVSVFLRAAGLSGAGVLWIRADDSASHDVAFINTQAKPVQGTTSWTPVTAFLAIPATAVRILVGVYAAGSGTLWADDVRVESDNGAPPLEFGFERASDLVGTPPSTLARSPHEQPRPMSEGGLANVTAFTRALGYVRFFHPSSQAVAVNWDEFAVRGVRAVEAAPDPDSLAATLRSLFAPIAPSVAFWRTGSREPSAESLPTGATHVVYWQHSGVGSPSGGARPNAQSVYRSVRVILPVSAVGKPVPTFGPAVAGAPVPTVPDPAKPIVEQLAGGVSMRLPVALLTTDAVVADSMRTARPVVARERLSAADRATRVADVALAWSLFQHFYPYFDVVHTDWPGALAPSLRAAATAVDADAFKATLQRLVAALHDGHGNVIRGTRGLAMPDVGLGWAEGHIVVTAPGDSGAAHGVQLGDVLLAIDGRPAEQVLAEQSELNSGATPQWVRTRTLTTLLLGPAKSPVMVRLRGPDGAPRDIQLPRTAPRQAEAKQIDKITDLAPGVMYVDLGRITDADFSAALPRLVSATGIVFDMRGYPSQVNTPAILAHLADSTIQSAHFEVPIITLPDRRDVGYTDGAWAVAPAPPRFHARVAMLSGGGAISYAESTLGVVEANHLAQIVGEPSAGTNGNVNPFTLPGGYTVIWTGMRVVKRDGSPHHGVGIIPDVRVSPTIAGIRAGRDEALERAVQLVKH